MAARIKPKRRRGHTRVSSRGQVTIPRATLAEADLAAGDELRVQVEGNRIVLSPAQGLAERRLAALEKAAGSMTGVYEPGDLDRLRDEWR
jgi:AbrB family looped-hinge helix DNA binding protein